MDANYGNLIPLLETPEKFISWLKNQDPANVFNSLDSTDCFLCNFLYSEGIEKEFSVWYEHIDIPSGEFYCYPWMENFQRTIGGIQLNEYRKVTVHDALSILEEMHEEV